MEMYCTRAVLHARRQHCDFCVYYSIAIAARFSLLPARAIRNQHQEYQAGIVTKNVTFSQIVTFMSRFRESRILLLNSFLKLP